MAKQNVSTTTGRKWRLRILAVVCVGGVLWYGLPVLAVYFAQQALAERDAVAAMRWLDMAAVAGQQRGKIEFLRARGLRRLGKIDEFRAALKSADEYGYSKEALDREQVLLLAQMGQLKNIEHRMAEILQAAGEDAGEACEAYASGLLITLRQTEALNVVDSWAKDYPHDAQPELARGMILKSINRNRKAQAAFRKALEIDPASYKAARELGVMLLETRHLDEALSVFEQLRDVPEFHDFALMQISRCHRQRGDLDAAEQALAELAEDTELSEGEVALQKGLLCHDRQSYEAALQHLSVAIAEQPRSIVARHARAEALRNLGKFDEAKAEAEAVAEAEAALSLIKKLKDDVAAAPRATAARYRIGQIELRYGNEQRGIIWLKSVINLNPSHAAANAQLAQYYEERAKTDDTYSALARTYRMAASSDKP